MQSLGYGMAMSLLGSAAANACNILAPQALPVLEAEDNPSFEVFLRLSQWVTCRPELDENVARAHFKVFQNEPWGKEHISRCFLKVKAAVETNAVQVSVPKMLKDEAFDGGEAWFIGHLLTTWYLGAYYHERTEPIRVTYEGALMWDAVADIAGIPGISGGEPDFWAENSHE